jgi:hypothetical protein
MNLILWLTTRHAIIYHPHTDRIRFSTSLNDRNSARPTGSENCERECRRPPQQREATVMNLLAECMNTLGGRGEIIMLRPYSPTYTCASDWTRQLRRQLMTYSIKLSPQKLLDSIFNKLPLFMCQWEKEKAVLYRDRSPAPITDSFHVATMARKQRAEFTRN